jgi:serine/threonine protein kinase
VKICDFGLARFKENTFVQTINGCAGTPNWMAPEGAPTHPSRRRRAL